MKQNFLVNNDDRVFQIYASSSDDRSESYVFGDQNNNLEFVVADGLIHYIESLYIDRVYSDNINLQDIRTNEDLDDLSGPFFFRDLSKPYKKTNFILNLVQNNLEIIISDNVEPYYCYIDDRVEYYYDEYRELIYIKVVNLNEYEYEFFKSYVKEDSLVK